MKQDIERLKALIQQLIVRLGNERATAAQLRNQLEAKDAELARTKAQLNDMRRKLNGILNQITSTPGGEDSQS